MINLDCVIEKISNDITEHLRLNGVKRYQLETGLENMLVGFNANGQKKIS